MAPETATRATSILGRFKTACTFCNMARLTLVPVCGLIAYSFYQNYTPSAPARTVARATPAAAATPAQ